MKRSFISILAVAGILISGCALEEAPSSEGCIRAIMENDETRTSVTDEGKFTWSAGDQIWLGTTSGRVIGTLSTGAGTASANFSYGSFFGEMTGKAVYPYNSGHSVKGEVLNMVLPASYDLGTSLQNTNAALYGVNVDGTLKFNHLAGVMRFKFKNVPAGVNQFVITLDKKINGTFEADLTKDYPVLETSETEVESEKTVTFNFDALTQTSDIMIYVPLPLGTYNSLGLALNNAEKSVWTYSNTVTNTIKRKKLILMPTVTLSGSIDGDLEGDGSEEEPMPEPQEGDYVDEYGINHGQGIKIGEIVWAPVNCGYHKTDYPWGKLYQWGRKYGQGYSLYYDATVPEIVVDLVKISQASDPSNSNVFYYNRTPPFNWASDFDDGLWNSGTESSPVKTDYDPCPEGWRVPTFNELADLSYNYSSWASNSSSQNGYYFSGEYTYLEDAPQVFLPAAGDRDYYGGDTMLRDSNGNYWSSRPNGIDAYCLYFNDSIVAMNYRYRSNGYSVRCVKEGSTSPTPSEPEEGESDYKYIVYKGTGQNNNTVTSGDSYWNLEPFFYSRVSDINEIELKFQMGPSSASAYDNEMRWLFSSERPYVNNGARLSADGLVLRYDNSGENVITNEKIITWDEMDVSITDKIILNISVSQKKISINGKEISVPELETFTSIEYLFSSYYYINDDGYAKNYAAVPVESKLYYAKIWDTSGSLLYHGYASEGEKSAGNIQPVWKSEYNGSTYLEFPNTNFQNFWVSTYTTNWLPFGEGIDSDNESKN